jgi:hypothetical protein
MTARDIPDPIKRLVRQKSGFGCVVCGLPIFDYEHIEEFAAVQTHNAANMVLLCPNHHAEKTRGRLSKEAIRRAADNPLNLRNERTAGHVFLQTGDIAHFEVAGTKFEYSFAGVNGRFQAIQLNGHGVAARSISGSGRSRRHWPGVGRRPRVPARRKDGCCGTSRRSARFLGRSSANFFALDCRRAPPCPAFTMSTLYATWAQRTPAVACQARSGSSAPSHRGGLPSQRSLAVSKHRSPKTCGGGEGVAGSSALGSAGLPPLISGSMELAVGSVEAGHPSSRRTSLRESTPAWRARCSDAQRALGSARSRSPRSITSRNSVQNAGGRPNDSTAANKGQTLAPRGHFMAMTA